MHEEKPTVQIGTRWRNLHTGRHAIVTHVEKSQWVAGLFIYTLSDGERTAESTLLKDWSPVNNKDPIEKENNIPLSGDYRLEVECPCCGRKLWITKSAGSHVVRCNQYNGPGCNKDFVVAIPQFATIAVQSYRIEGL